MKYIITPKGERLNRFYRKINKTDVDPLPSIIDDGDGNHLLQLTFTNNIPIKFRIADNYEMYKKGEK